MPTAKGKTPTAARWGWHGTGIISLPRTAIPGGHDTLAQAAPDLLRAIAARLARTPDDAQRIEAELVSVTFGLSSVPAARRVWAGTRRTTHRVARAREVRGPRDRFAQHGDLSVARASISRVGSD